MGTIDPRDAIPLSDEGKRLQDEYRQRMKETLAEIPTFDADQMRKDAIRIHADAIHQMGGDPVQRSYVDALTERLAAAEQRAADAEATLATIGGADKATLARKLRRANAATRDAEQRATESEKVITALAAYRDADRDYFASGISEEERSSRARRCSEARHVMFSALWHYEDSALQSAKRLAEVREK